MNSPICPIHNLEAKWREGEGKNGHYAFFACAITKAQNGGEYCKHKFPQPTTPMEKFDNDLNQSVAVQKQDKKDETIARIALVKSAIEAGWRWDEDTAAELNIWLGWVKKV